jgi:flagellar motor switch protein FliN/FliY
MAGAADMAPGAGPAGLAAEVANAAGLEARAAGTVIAFGRFVAQRAAEALSVAVAQPVRIGPAAVRRVVPGTLENENWDLYHPIDVLWEIDGQAHAAILLLPKAELQTLLPAAGGMSELPDMEALGRLLRELAAHVSDELALGPYPPIRLSLPEAAAVPHDPSQALVHVEHSVAAGHPGVETSFDVIHLIPAAVLQAVAGAERSEGAGQDASEAHGDVTTVTADMTTGVTAVGAAARGPQTDVEEIMTSAGAPGGASTTGPAGLAGGTSVHPVQFQAFDSGSDAPSATNLDLLLDVPLRVTVELGRTELTIKEVLALGPGSVIELDKLAGEPVDILVNNRLIAKGEVVVVDENFGVRVTDIESPHKRLSRLK